MWSGTVSARLGGTFKEIAREKHVLFFLLAFFFYIDGVYTVIDMATAYGQALGLDSTGLLLALLLTQIVAFPCVLIFSRLCKKAGFHNNYYDMYCRLFLYSAVCIRFRYSA